MAAEARHAVAAHVAELTAQIARILTDGVASGDFAVGDVNAAATALFTATARFHNPMHAAEWTNPDNDAAFDGLWTLLERAIAQR